MLSKVIVQTRGKASKLGYYSHDVKVPYPPKTRSKVWSLAQHKKLVFVTHGHINEYRDDEAPLPRPVVAVAFAKCNTYKLIHTMTRSEFEFLVENEAKIMKWFEEQEKLLPEQEAQDAASRHVCI